MDRHLDVGDLHQHDRRGIAERPARLQRPVVADAERPSRRAALLEVPVHPGLKLQHRREVGLRARRSGAELELVDEDVRTAVVARIVAAVVDPQPERCIGQRIRLGDVVAVGDLATQAERAVRRDRDGHTRGHGQHQVLEHDVDVGAVKAAVVLEASDQTLERFLVEREGDRPEADRPWRRRIVDEPGKVVARPLEVLAAARARDQQDVVQRSDGNVPQRGPVDRDGGVGLENHVAVGPQVKADVGADHRRVRIAPLLDFEAVLVVDAELAEVAVDEGCGVVGLDHARWQHEVDGQVLDQHLVTAAVGGEEDGRQLVASGRQQLDPDVRQGAEVQRQRRRCGADDVEVGAERDLTRCPAAGIGRGAEHDIAVRAGPNVVEGKDPLQPVDDLRTVVGDVVALGRADRVRWPQLCRGGVAVCRG